MKTGPRLAALFALLVSWLNSLLDSLVVAMKAVLNVETYLHYSQDLRGTQHGLWPGLSPNLHLSDYRRVVRDPGTIRRPSSSDHIYSLSDCRIGGRSGASPGGESFDRYLFEALRSRHP